MKQALSLPILPPPSPAPAPPSPEPSKTRKSLPKHDFLKDIDLEKQDDSRNRGSRKNVIFGGSSYSKALLRGEGSKNASFCSDSVNLQITVESLKFLEGTKYLFFRKCKTFPPELASFNPKKKRGIWNNAGRVVYYTGEQSSSICKRCYYSEFIQEVVDYTGRPVLTSRGRQALFGLNSSVEIYLEGERLLGTMNQSCLSSTYDIRDCTGRLIYKIQAPCFAPCAPFVFWCCNEHFEICMDDGVSEIGFIKKYWDSSVTVPEFQHVPGIEMDRADDTRVKALLLGCFFLIEFQYYRGLGNGPLYFLLMMAIFAGMLIVSECAGYCPMWMDETGIERVNIV